MSVFVYLVMIFIAVASVGITLYFTKLKKDGVIVVDPFGNDVPIQLKLTINIDELMHRKYIVLKVDARQFVSFDISAEIEKPKD